MSEPGARDQQSDEAFLDHAFEVAVERLEEGASISVGELLGGRESLRAQVEQLMLDARATVCIGDGALPRVRGYSIVEELGRGGMGAVYLARQEALGGRRVALKLLPSGAAFSARARERFLREARTLASIRHPHVVTVHDVVESEHVCAYAMEWVDGVSLAGLIQRAVTSKSPSEALHGALQVANARAGEDYTVFVCRTAIAVARALGALHRAGLVHRDVKPSNVLLRRDGTALLSDFGLAHASDAGLTRSGEFVGTVLYASPEQLDGEAESLDARSDVYALGVTLYHALTLHLPFDEPSSTQRRAGTPTGMLRLLESRSAVPLRVRDPKLPRDLETIVAKAIEIEHRRRYTSADELAYDLERLLALRPIHAQRASWLSRSTKFVRRHRAAARGVLVGSAVSLVLAVLAVTYVFFVPRWVDEHVREARLALLDPSYANKLFVAEQFRLGDSDTAPVLEDAALERALASYDAALRWRRFDDALRRERDEVERVLAGESASAPDPRLSGLASYLMGDTTAAVRHWTEFERDHAGSAAPDPLVESMLGLTLLVRGDAARAYPRLREACRAFPQVGFLAVYQAEAAVRCGDIDVAERLLARAEVMTQPDPIHARERVLGDVCVARERVEDALRHYRAAHESPIAVLSMARLLMRLERTSEALEQYRIALRRLRSAEIEAEYDALVEQWWACLTEAARIAAVVDTLELSPTDPRSLVAILGAFGRHGDRIEPVPSRGFFATLRHWRSSPPLQSLGLPELAALLEVDDMQRWSEISGYPRAIKPLQLLAWRSPWPHEASQRLAAIVAAVRGRTYRTPLLAAALATSGGLASAQVCGGAPCFQGIGDLPGGAYYSRASCLSGDGTRVGGASTTDLSTPQPFQGTLAFEPALWDSAGGLVAIGELAGGLVSGEVLGLSLDGAVAVGWSASGNCTVNLQLDAEYAEGFHWSAGSGMVGMGDSSGGGFYSMARAVSDDGSQIAGVSTTDGAQGSNVFSSRASLGGSWAIDGGQALYQSLWWSMSRNGQWMVGRRIQQWPVGPTSTILWSQSTGSQTILSVPNQVSSGFWANDVSDTGVVVGTNYTTSPHRAWRWTQSGGYEELADLPGGTTECFANAVTQDASIIVGHSTTALGREAALWLNPCAVFRLHDVLVAAGVSMPSGWLLQECKDITVNGAEITICGNGLNPAGQPEGWVARFVAPWPAGIAYCTAGTTSSGCNASMSSNGTPSVAATSGFTLHCSNVEGQKFGLIFYGANGPKSSPWAPGSSSFLCVKAPVQRSAASNSGGTAGACDGSFSLDFLAYLASHPGALGQPFAAGQCVNAQTWFRDPPAPGTTNLSNGLQFVTTP